MLYSSIHCMLQLLRLLVGLTYETAADIVPTAQQLG